MSNSDILNEYFKIALEKGLVSEAKDDAKKILEKTRRADSQSISDISSLYGIKTDKEKSQEYERNIAEVAHPNASFVSPSHDKLNGTVWDINRKQNIALNIVNKPVNGLLTHHKYAKQELIKSLIRAANHMDNLNKDNLRILADECITGLSNKYADASSSEETKEDSSFKDVISKLRKEDTESILEMGKDISKGTGVGTVIGLLVAAVAAPFVSLPTLTILGAGLALGATGGTVLSTLFATGPQAKNVAINSQKLKDELSDLIDDHPKDVLLNDMMKELTSLKVMALRYHDLISKIEGDIVKIKNKESITTSEFIYDKGVVVSYGESYVKQLDVVRTQLDMFLGNLERGDYEEEESDIGGKLKDVLRVLFGGDVHQTKDAAIALEQVMTHAKDNFNKLKKDLGRSDSMLAEFDKKYQSPPISPSSSTSPSSPTLDLGAKEHEYQQFVDMYNRYTKGNS